MDKYETYLMDYLQRFPGQQVSLWEVLNTLAKILATDTSKATIRLETKLLSTALYKLIRDGKIKRYRKVNGKNVNLIRINEAYVVND